MSTIPEKVKVAGFTYTIRLVEGEWGEHTEKHGQCDPSKLEIIVVDDVRVKETLWHEIGHAIYYEYNIKEVKGEEAINSLYMLGIFQVLVDNTAMRKLI